MPEKSTFSIALISWSDYKDLLYRKSVFLFSFIIILIYSLLTYVPTLLQLHDGFMRLSNKMSDFTLESGKLTVSDTIEYDSGDLYIYINTNTPLQSWIPPDHSVCVLSSSDQLAIYAYGSKNFFEYSKILKGVRITKEKFTSEFVGFWLIVLFLLLLAASYVILFITSIIISIIAQLVNVSIGCGLPYKYVYKLSLYSRGMPTLMFGMLANMRMAYLYLVSPICSLVIMFIALASIKAEGEADQEHNALKQKKRKMENKLERMQYAEQKEQRINEKAHEEQRQELADQLAQLQRLAEIASFDDDSSVSEKALADDSIDNASSVANDTQKTLNDNTFEDIDDYEALEELENIDDCID